MESHKTTRVAQSPDLLQSITIRVGEVEYVEPTGVITDAGEFIPAEMLIKGVASPGQSLTVVAQQTSAALPVFALKV